MIYSNTTFRGYLLIVLFILFFTTSMALFMLLIQGKRLTPSGEIVETGVLRVNSIPNNVDIFINGKSVSRSGNLVQNIPIGEITLQLTKEGYTTWEKEILIDSSKVKEIFAQLYPEDLNLEQVQTFDADQIVFSEDYNTAFYTVLNSEELDEIGIWKQEYDEGFLSLGSSSEPVKIHNLTAEERQQLLENPYSISISPNGGNILVNVQNINVYSISSSTSETSESITNLLGFYPEYIDWLTSSTLIIKHNNVVYEQSLNSVNNDLISFSPNSEPIICHSGSSVYWKDNNNRIYKYNNGTSVLLEGKNELSLNFSYILSLSCSETEDIFLVEDISGTYYVDYDLSYMRNIGQNITVIDISNDGKSVLVKTNDKYSVFNMKETAPNIVVGETYPLEFSGDSEIYFSQSNRSIVIVEKDQQGKEIVMLADLDGNNSSVIVSELITSNDHIPYLSSDNKEMLLVLEETAPLEVETTEESNSFTLYSVDLDN